MVDEPIVDIADFLKRLVPNRCTVIISWDKLTKDYAHRVHDGPDIPDDALMVIRTRPNGAPTGAEVNEFIANYRTHGEDAPNMWTATPDGLWQIMWVDRTLVEQDPATLERTVNELRDKDEFIELVKAQGVYVQFITWDKMTS